ncbi:MAG: S8 family serine peptidase [Thermoproteota archaeon]|nr:S8 family serine peptidase [Thermoproteota archaeon]
MDSLEQVRLQSLMAISTGIPEVVIGLIDGPIDFNHAAFEGSNVTTVKGSQHAACRSADSLACMHGTFIAGMLCARRGSSAPAICPNCKLLLYPIFSEGEKEALNRKGHEGLLPIPSTTPKELSDAIIETIDAGARIINISAGLSASSLVAYRDLEDAYDYAMRNGVIVVAAAGNQGNIGGYRSLFGHQWVIPVAACDENGRLDPMSNFGPSIGYRGLMAPGVNITSTSPGGQYTQLSGTSFATPFVTGTIALLWSLFPQTTTTQIIHCISRSASTNRRVIIPPILHAEAALKLLKVINK